MSGSSVLPGWRYALRDRGLRLLAFAVLVAVAALTSVGFFADRVERTLALEGAAILGGDLVIEQNDPIDPAWVAHATGLGLATARTVTFPSVILANERPVLVQVKAVDPGYPLRGRLRVETPDGVETGAPPVGGAWLEARLRDRLDARSGETAVQLGEMTLTASGVLYEEPDRGGSLFQLSPRLMVTYADVEASGLLGPASRVDHYLQIAGDAAAVGAMRAWLEPRLAPDAEVMDVENARPELRRALERAQRFLNLAALCASLLAGIAMLLATRRYVERALDGAAVLRTLGMSGAAVLRWHLWQLGAVVALAVFGGGLLGLLGQQALVAVIGDWFGTELPPPGMRPLLVGAVFGFALVAGFSLPTLWRLGRVPPLRVLRRDLAAPGLSGWLTWAVGAAVFLGLLVWQVRDLRLALAVALAVFAALAALMLAGYLLLRLLAPLRRTGGTAALGLAALARYPQLTLLQLAGFGLGITVLLLLAVVRVDIIETWQATLPEDAPNHFLLNVQPDEREAVQALFDERRIPHSGLHPTTRARLVAINDDAIEPEQFADGRTRRFALREYSLSFNQDMQRDNRVLQGSWWGADGADRPAFSIEAGMADTLGLEVGDRLTFDIAGQEVSAPVTSVRSVAWDSFNVNFFVVGTPALARDLPVAYLSSFHLGGDSAPLIREFAQRFPAVSILDLRPLLEQVRTIMARGSLAVEMVFVFTLIAAALVTLAAAQVSRDARAREVAVMRTIGASRRQLAGAVLVEFGLLGFIGGLLGAALAALSGYLVAVELFDLPGRIGPAVWWLGIGAGTLTVALVGWLATRRLLAVPPLRVLNSG
jgi:putative ABC transport system permease protein